MSIDFVVQTVTVLSVLGTFIAYISQKWNKRIQSIEKKIQQLVQQDACKQRRKNCPCCTQVKVMQSFVKK